MYIPTWLIIIAIIAGTYFYSRLKKQGNLNDNMPQIFKQKFSYKLDIYIEPNWYKIYKKLHSAKSEKEFEKIFEEKHKKMEKDDTSSLWGRRYCFTEYYDSVSGLTTRFQRVIYQNGKQYFYPVDEFGNRGYIFESDSSSHLNIQDKNYEKKRNEHLKLSVQVGENFIRNDIFDKHIGVPRSDYEKENYLFLFPLGEVFNFLFTLGQKFHDRENKPIIKWPDNIEKKFKELGIKYEIFFDYEPTEFKIEKHDKELYEKLGKPKTALFGDEKGYLSSDEASYGVNLKIFRPSENNRIPTDS